jgi:hypothetical protein
MVHAEAPQPGGSNTPLFPCVKVTGRESNCVANTVSEDAFSSKMYIMTAQDASATNFLAAPC